MLFDDAVTRRQTESRAAGFSREERREDLRQIFLGDAAALVRDVDPDETVGRAVLAANMEVGLQAGGHRQRAGIGHRLEGILDQVEKYLHELGAVSVDRRQTRIEGCL